MNTKSKVISVVSAWALVASTLLPITASAYDFCKGTVFGKEVSFSSPLDGSYNHDLTVTQKDDQGRYVDRYFTHSLLQYDNNGNRIYSGTNNGTSISLTIVNKCTKSLDGPKICPGIVQSSSWPAGTKVSISCQTDISYNSTNYSGGNCASNPHCH